MTPVREPAITGVCEGVCVGPGSETVDTEDNAVVTRLAGKTVWSEPDDVLAEDMRSRERGRGGMRDGCYYLRWDMEYKRW